MRLIHWCSFLLVLLAGCSPPEVDLLRGAEREGRLEDRRRRMNLEVQLLTPEGLPSGDPVEHTPEDFLQWVSNSCDLVASTGVTTIPEAGVATIADDCTDPTGCAVASCFSQHEVCVAQRLLEIISAPFPVRVDYLASSTPVRAQVSPPTPEAQIALAEAALDRSSEAVVEAGEELRALAGLSPLPTETIDCTDTAEAAREEFEIGESPEPVSYAVALARFFVEAQLVADEAARMAVQRHADVADAEFSRSDDSAVAAELAWVDGIMSRSRAAHLLLGGPRDGGLYGLWGEGFCPDEPPDGDVRNAIDIIRESGADPTLVYDEGVSTRRLLEGPHGDDAAEGIGARLAERRGQPGLALLDAASLAEALDVDLDAFSQARRYLRHEGTAFGRDLGAILPPEPYDTEDDGMGGVTLVTTTADSYGATALEPTVAPAAYYNALTRYSDPWISDADLDDRDSPSDDGLVVPRPDYARSSFGALVDYALSVAHDASAATTTGSPLGGSLPDDAIDILARFASDQSFRRPARIETCYQYDGQFDNFRIRVYGYDDPAEIIFVEDAGGLRCGVLGNVDGADCDLADYEVAMGGGATGTIDPVDRDVGFSTYAEFSQMFGYDFGTPQPDWIYVLRLKAGRSPDEPGAYEAIGAHRVERRTSVYPWNYCELQPVEPELTDLAASLVTPNPDNCARPAKSCAGMDPNAPIPLENELTDDGNGVENSWRYYLDRAMEAATYADSLGEDLIDAGFHIDESIELAEADLESTCGGAISLRDFAWGDLDESRGGACDSSAEDTCPGGFKCVNDACVRDLDSTLEMLADTNPDARHLLNCLGEGSVVPLATLGTQDMCVWRRADAEESDPPCEVPVDMAGDPIPISKACPFAPSESGECERPPELPADYEVLPPVSDHLGVFETIIPPSDDSSALEGAQVDCNVIRELRESASRLDSLSTEQQTAREEQLESLRTSGLFDFSTLQSIASRVGWRGYPLDYSAITVDGQDKWFTGFPLINGTEVITNGWPCDHPNELAMTDSERALFESGAPYTCVGPMELDVPFFESFTCGCSVEATGDNRLDRSRMNLRMARAVFALRLLTGVGLQGFEGPYVPDPKKLVWEADRDAEACPDDGGATSCDFWRYAWNFDSPAYVDIVNVGGLQQQTGEIRYWVKETDSGDDTTDVPVRGTSYCLPTGSSAVLWTYLTDYDATPTYQFMTTCDNSGVSTRNDDPFYGPVVFLDHASLLTASGDEPAARTWWGLTPHTRAADHGLTGLVSRALGTADPDSHMLVSLDELTDYWRDCPSVERCSDDRNLTVEARNFMRLEYGLTARDVLDAVELACEMDSQENGTCADALTLRPSTFQDLSLARKQLECVAQLIADDAQRTVLRHVPAEALPDYSEPTSYEGDRGEEVSKLVAAYRRLHDHQRHIGEEIEDFSADIEILRNAIRNTSVQKQLAELELTSTEWSQWSACAGAAARAAGAAIPLLGDGGEGGFVGAAGAAAATCANSAAQVSLAYERLELQEESLELADDMSWATFRERFRAHHRALKDMKGLIEDELEIIQGASGALEAHRQSARRKAAAGMMFHSESMGRHFATNAVMRARYNTLRIRYDEAYRYAIRMAYLARRALEQRLGMPLSSIHEDLSFVEAPAGWADEVCTMRPVDYQRLTDDVAAPDNFADAYIGDYVRRLEQVFNSYNVDFNFTDGPDTAVISMRDDVVLARAACSQPVNNFLGDSADLRAGAWNLEGCTPVDPNPLVPICPDPSTVPEGGPWPPCVDGSTVLDDCVSIEKLEDPADQPIPYHRPDLGPASGYRVVFAPGTGTSFQANTTSELDPTALAQRVTLPAGTYRLSWRARDTVVNSVTYPGASAVQVQEVVTDAGGETFDPITTYRPPPITGTGWPLHYSFFELTEPEQTVRIGILGLPDETGTHGIEVGALMLEDVTGKVTMDTASDDAPEDAPPGYVATTDPGIGKLLICEDTYGDNFRRRWSYACTQLCDTGFGSCDDGPTHCYWERRFSVSLADLESSTVLSRAGFARGNYNYRIAGLGLNFVGTNLRDCSGTRFGATCYSAGYLNYSIYHEGTYRVRNHRGETYDAPLFTGNIEQARGLAAERYVTNPLSSGDHALIDDYMRHELDGRPLTGDYVVRIWDDGTVDFEALEDVQVVLQYRYWTRSE